MVIPFMSIYLTYHFGAATSGVMMIVTILLGIVASFYGGYYSDLKGRKKILTAGEFGKFACVLGMAVCNSSWFASPLLTYGWFIVHTVVSNASSPAGDAMIVDVSTPNTRKYIYSINYWAINLSLAIGSIIGAFFYQHYFFELLICTALATLCIFFIYVFYIEETMPSTTRSTPEKVQIFKMFSSYKQVFQDLVFFKFILSSLLTMAIEFQLANYVAVRLSAQFPEQSLIDWHTLHLHVTGVEMYGIIRAENTISVVLLAIFIERILKRVQEPLRLYVGTILFIGGFMFVGASNSVWVLLIATLIYTFGEMVYVPVKQSMLTVLVKDDARTRYMAVYALHYRGGMIIASLCITLGAWIPAWAMSALYGVIGLLVINLYLQIAKKHSFSESINQVTS